jgi:hypothetical protein
MALTCAPRDPHALPGAYARFTDAAKMRAIFQERLPAFAGGTLLIRRCEVLHVRHRAHLREKYRARSFLGASYRLEVSDPTTHTDGSQIVYAKARLDGASRAESEQAKAGRLSPPRYGDPVVHLPELDAVVWAFPNDPQLPSLAEVTQPPRLVRHLPPAVLPVALASASCPPEIEVDVVHYYPERRCTSRYRLRWGTVEHRETLTLYGKTFRGNTGRRVHRTMTALHHQARVHPDAFAVPRPLAYDDTTATLWQEELPGCPLAAAVDRTELRRVAAGLARLHRGRVAGLPVLTIDQHLRSLRDKTEKLAHALPDLAPRLEGLVVDLEATACHLTPVPDRPIHGDFHIRQLLTLEGALALFDFDECAIADPTQDLATFVVDLNLTGLDRAVAADMSSVLLDAYRARVDWPVRGDRLRWHLKLQLLTKAYRSYRRLAPEMRLECERAVALAEDVPRLQATLLSRGD